MIDIEWITIPAGSFEMGAVDDDKFATDLERPRKRVTITAAFAMSQYPVTVKQYRAYLLAEPNAYTPHGIDQAEADQPVMGLNRTDALGFCAWLSQTTGQTISLPTEAQWEYACRAGTRSVFYTGDVISLTQANYAHDENGRVIGLNHSTPVGQYPPNPWGLCDMLGSVMELVADDWQPGLASTPSFGQTTKSVVRGGAWDHMPRLLRCSHRDWIDHQNPRVSNVGFRIITAG